MDARSLSQVFHVKADTLDQSQVETTDLPEFEPVCESASSDSFSVVNALSDDEEGPQSEECCPKVVGHFPSCTTPLLDSLNDDGPQKMRSMDVEQLAQLADEVRWQVLDAVSVTGGHLGSALGVVELTVALHHVFETPRDEICWDVAHQVYPHKILTCRRGQIYTLRQGGGLSGFAKRCESQYDSFGAGHSATSISAALGFQVAHDFKKEVGHSVAVIGDGAITGGMAFEGMNHAGGLNSKMFVILNDNGQVSLPTFYNAVDEPVCALSRTFAEWQEGCEVSGKGAFFEQLGFHYAGPIDGHDMGSLVETLSDLKKAHQDNIINQPILLHVKTVKGKGYNPAEAARDKLHAVKPKFNVEKQTSSVPALVPKAPLPQLTTVFGESLVKEGEQDEKIVAITAAMPGGTGVSIFEERFGSARTFDVGIAEQHAVTFAAGLAAGGLKPFCCIYSTFLQRGYDQVVHDVALQNLPVRFVIDRAGLVGADGPTHGGSFDLSFLACIPNLKICAPADEVELVHMTHTLAQLNDCPSAMRYPRGAGYGDDPLPEEPQFLQPGKGRIVRQGQEGTVAILSVGARLRESQHAADCLEKHGIFATVADARWVKPLDIELVEKLAEEHKVLITVEENSIGGFASQVSQVLLDGGFLDGCNGKQLAMRNMVLPDRFIPADEPHNQYDDAQLNASHIVSKALSALSRVGVLVDCKAIANDAGYAQP
jgi:1-deoxy-D-xylulose-5-phosphate synthase